MSKLYRLYNEGDLPHCGTGFISVIELPPGRKWVTVIEWTTLNSQRLDKTIWERIRKVECTHAMGYYKTHIQTRMREQLKYVEETQDIREALNTLEIAS